MGDVHNFYRVFMAPGMAHCYGGPGPNSFGNGNNDGPVIDAKHDLLKALEMWVERGIAPKKFIATKYFNDNPAKGVALQRPLCPYPQISRYDGRGHISIRQASNVLRKRAITIRETVASKIRIDELLQVVSRSTDR